MTHEEMGVHIIEDELRSEIAWLTKAIWEYGQHGKSCRIDDGKECDCGFFEIIKDLN